MEADFHTSEVNVLRAVAKQEGKGSLAELLGEVILEHRQGLDPVLDHASQILP